MFPQLPANLADLTDEDLATLETDLTVAVANAAATGHNPDELADAAGDLQAVIVETSLRARIHDVRDDLLAELAALTDTPPDEQPADEPAAEPAADAEQPAAADETAEQAADEPAAEEPDQVIDPAALAANDPITVPARPADTANTTVVLATDLRGRGTGSVVADIDDLTGVLHDAARRLPDPSGRVQVAAISLNDGGPAFTDNPDANGQIIADIVAEHTTVASLTAAGGWCRPSAVRYDFFSIEASDGLVDLPEVTVTAGLRYPVSPSVNDLLATDALWLWTETNDVAAATDEQVRKTELRIPCVTFNETRLDAHGVTLRHGNLSDRAWPALTQRMTRLALVAHNHTVNSRFLTAMASGSTAIDLTAEITMSSVTAAFLHAVTLRAEIYRSYYKMSQDALIEAVAPGWLRGAFQTDISKRSGVLELGLTDNDIAAALAARNIRVQWVEDWQQPSISAEKFPVTADVLLYAPGTWARGNGGTLDLGVVRDHTLNAMNDHTALWTEQFLSLMKFGYRSEKVTIPVNTRGAAFCCDSSFVGS